MDFATFWSTWADGIFRWLHVAAGIMWIGHLWFFNFVNAQLAKTEMAGAAVSWVLVVAVAFLYSKLGYSGRAIYIHTGAMFGTIMMLNVWMRIWPNQRKIIAGVKGTGPAADPSVPALAGLRS